MDRKMRLETYEQIEDIVDVMIKAAPGLLRPSQIEDKVRWRYWFIKLMKPANAVCYRLKLLRKLDIVIRREDRRKRYYELLYDVIPKRHETEIMKKVPSIFRDIIECQMDYENLRNDLLHSESYRSSLSVLDALQDMKKAAFGIKLKLQEYDTEKLLYVIERTESLMKIYQSYYRSRKFKTDAEQAAYLKFIGSLHMLYNINPKGW
jgi:DNA-binding transcriptional ArsR family regulator